MRKTWYNVIAKELIDFDVYCVLSFDFGKNVVITGKEMYSIASGSFFVII